MTSTQAIEALSAGRSYIRHISADRLAILTRERFRGTTDSPLTEADAIVICVPTPLTRHLEPDMSFVVSTLKSMAPHIRIGQLIVLESTTYPGTTRELVQAILAEGSGLEVNREFFVAFSAEREDPGSSEFESANIPGNWCGNAGRCCHGGRALPGARQSSGAGIIIRRSPVQVRAPHKINDLRLDRKVAARVVVAYW